MATVELGGGVVALIDDADVSLVAGYRWRVLKSPPPFTSYARARLRQSDGSEKTLRMHRLLMNAPAGVWVDHINGDGLDNRRANLRFCTVAENSRNRRIHWNNATGYKGVYWGGNAARSKPWRAAVRVNGKAIVLGWFATPSEAHVAYCAAAKEHHGEFARLA